MSTNEPVQKIKIQWKHSLIQTVFIGILAFSCPGLYNALISLGKAGGSDADVAAIGNASVYASFVIFGFFGGPCFNLFGPKVLIFCGGLTYSVYSACLTFTSSKVITAIGGVILGAGAGWFWTAQGALMMAYAPGNRKGLYISVFWVIFNLGGVLGGFSAMILNWKSTEGSASLATRLVYIILMLLGATSGLLIAQPKDVIREDGEPCTLEKAVSAKTEIKNALMMVTNRNMQSLTLLFFITNYIYAYQFEGINGLYFKIRTRGFNSAMFWIAQMCGSVSIGRVLDNKHKNTRSRGYIGFLIMAGFLLGTFLADFLYQCFLKPKYLVKTFDSITRTWIEPSESARIDLIQSDAAYIPIIIYILYGVSDAMLQSFAYWMISTLSGANFSLAANYAGYYKAVQSLGSTVSWVLSMYLSFVTQLWINVVLFVIALPTAALTIKNLPD